MQTVTLTWNVTNWITIVLMALLGYALIGFLATGAKNLWPSSNGSSGSANNNSAYGNS